MIYAFLLRYTFARISLIILKYFYMLMEVRIVIENKIERNESKIFKMEDYVC